MRNRIVECALSYKDVPYRHQGRSRQGVDCAGLPYCVAIELGLIAPYSESAYLRRTNKTELVQRVRAAGLIQKSSADLKPGDILLFKQSIYACHLAIYLGQDRIIHAHRMRDKVVIEPYSQFWLDRVVGCYRYPGVS